MKKVHLPNEKLIYTDIPSNRRKLAILRGLHQRGRDDEIPPIFVVKFPGNGLCLFEGQEYAIIDGNHRAFVAQEHGKAVPAEVIETDEDLSMVEQKLNRDHYIFREGSCIKTVRKLLDEIDLYLRSIMDSQPVWYAGKDE